LFGKFRCDAKRRYIRQGARLSADAARAGVARRQAVPGSINGPTSYSLSESYEFTPAGKPAVIVVLVQRFSQGFEGRDRRFLAVTGQPH
jgi:hypothetical protein